MNNNNQYYILFTIYIISLIIIFILYVCSKYNKNLNNIMTKCCLIKYKSNITDFIIKYRGTKYNDLMDTKNCILTYWHLSHSLLYIFIGFFCPKLFLLSFFIGVLWEILEYFVNQQDITDIIFNTIGFSIGYSINKLFIKKG